jgi:hypothetical protein
MIKGFVTTRNSSCGVIALLTRLTVAAPHETLVKWTNLFVHRVALNSSPA